VLSERDLDYYMIWSGFAPQSRAAMRPQLQRAMRWLAETGVARSPLRPRLPWYSFEAARSHDLINLWLLQARPVSDKRAEHQLRNLLARRGAGVRPCKPAVWAGSARCRTSLPPVGPRARG
jgi:hypothetical protein